MLKAPDLILEKTVMVVDERISSVTSSAEIVAQNDMVQVVEIANDREKDLDVLSKKSHLLIT